MEHTHELIEVEIDVPSGSLPLNVIKLQSRNWRGGVIFEQVTVLDNDITMLEVRQVMALHEIALERAIEAA